MALYYISIHLELLKVTTSRTGDEIEKLRLENVMIPLEPISGVKSPTYPTCGKIITVQINTER